MFKGIIIICMIIKNRIIASNVIFKNEVGVRMNLSGPDLVYSYISMSEVDYFRNSKKIIKNITIHVGNLFGLKECFFDIISVICRRIVN